MKGKIVLLNWQRWVRKGVKISSWEFIFMKLGTLGFICLMPLMLNWATAKTDESPSWFLILVSYFNSLIPYLAVLLLIMALIMFGIKGFEYESAKSVD